MSALQWIGGDLFAAVLERARQSPRRRMNFNFHGSMEENPHRLLNVMLEGTYIRPHRHVDPPKAESFLAIEGCIGFFVFDDEGRITTARVLGNDGVLGVDIAPGVWHTMTAVSPHAVCYEVKPGPYQPMSDKEFAVWAPPEGDPRVPEYLQTLLAALPR